MTCSEFSRKFSERVFLCHQLIHFHSCLSVVFRHFLKQRGFKVWDAEKVRQDCSCFCLDFITVGFLQCYYCTLYTWSSGAYILCLWPLWRVFPQTIRCPCPPQLKVSARQVQRFCKLCKGTTFPLNQSTRQCFDDVLRMCNYPGCKKRRKCTQNLTNLSTPPVSSGLAKTWQHLLNKCTAYMKVKTNNSFL